MRQIRFLLCAAILCLSGTAQAQSFDAAVYAADVRGWQVDALTDGQGFLGCGGTTDQPFGVLGVIQSRDGWLLRVPTQQTESFEGAVVTIGNRQIDAQIGFLPEGAGEIYLTDQAIGWLAQADEVTVAVNNDYTATWGLLGSAAMITKVKECYARKGSAKAAIAAPKAAVSVVKAPESDAQRGGIDCPAPGSVASTGNGTPAQLQFYNATDRAVTLYWLDFNGMPVEYAALLPGEDWTVETWAEHPWIARDFEGTCRGGVIYPAPGNSVWEIY